MIVFKNYVFFWYKYNLKKMAKNNDFLMTYQLYA